MIITAANVGDLVLSDPRCRAALPRLARHFRAWANGTAAGLAAVRRAACHGFLADISGGEAEALAGVLGEVTLSRPATDLVRTCECGPDGMGPALESLRGWNLFLWRDRERRYLGGWR